jgi:tetratricopeptide (TPR) repeat protein
MEPKAGVRIGFSLTGRGDKIDLEIIQWLKNTIKDYIGKSLEQFSYGSWGKVRFLDITTLHVDFPREKPLNSPLNYRQCIRSAISLSHQIALRWALTPFCSQNRFLAIGIAAGNFASLDRHLRVTLETKLAGDPVIRLTDFARQCVLVNEIRAALCAKPEEMTLHNGENLNIWWVVGVWSTIYFDFVPEMLDDPLLGNKTDAAQELFNQLLGNLSHNQSGLVKEKSNAVVAFFRSPHNTMLGMEIAKVLYYRRRFWDAIQILKILLSLNDDHIHARSLLMVLYRSLALSAPKIQIAERLFKQARKEADYILANCEYQSEDFYCEYAVIFLAKAMLMLKELRLRSDPNEQHCEVRQAKKNIFAALSKAEDLFETAIMVSPSGIRAHYLRNSVALIKCILKNDEKIFTDRHRPLDGSPDTIRQMNIDNQWQYGFLREDIPEAYPYESMEKIFNAFFHSHDDSIALEAYRPTIYFCSAVSWWDLFPLRTVGTAKRVIQLLKEALSIADAMDAKGLCIYSFTRTYGEMLPAKEFMEHLTKAIEMVYSYCSGYLDQRDNLKVIKPANPKRAALLTTLNFP